MADTPINPITPIIKDPNPNVGGLYDYERAQINLPSFGGGQMATPQQGLFSGGITPLSSIPTNGRYPFYYREQDNENMYGEAQSFGEKFLNSSIKLGGIAATTFLSGTAGMVYGTYKGIADGKFSSFYNNEFTRQLDEFNKEMEDKYAAYYTNREANADFWSTDNLFTANFLFDKVYKNLGFAAGAWLGGGAWGGALKALGLFAKTAAAGGAAEAAAVSSEAIVNAGAAGERLTKVGKSLADVAKKYASNFKSSDMAQRAILSGIMTSGEASIEALDGMNRFRESALDAFIVEHGRQPNADEMQKIDAAAAASGNMRFMANVALLSATNYIQFPKILGSSVKGEKSAIAGFADDINDIRNAAKPGKAASYERTLPKSTLGKVAKTGKDILGLTFAPSEAFEEGAQFVIEKGVENFWNKKYKANDPINQSFLQILAGYGEFLTSKEGVGEGISELTSKEGLESLVVGGLSGGLMTMKGTIKERSAKKKNTAAAIDAFNKSTVDSYFSDLKDNVNRAEVIQEERVQSLENGEIFPAKNLESDYLYTYVGTRVKYGRFDLINEELDQVSEALMTEDGKRQLRERGILAEGVSEETVKKRIADMRKAAVKVKETYETLQFRYGTIKDDEGKPKYSKEAIDKLAYAAFKIDDFDSRIPVLNADVSSLGIDVSPLMVHLDKDNKDVTDIEKLEKDELLKNVLIEAIKENATLLDTEKEEKIEKLEDLYGLALLRKKFANEYNDILKNPQKYTKGFEPFIPKSAANEPSDFIIDYPDGKKAYKTNTPYFAIFTDGLTYDKEKVLGHATFTITEVDDNGNVTVLTDKGETKTYTAEEFKKNVRLVTEEEVNANPDLSFFIKNRNEIVVKQMGKGRTKEGVLDYIYKDKQLVFKYKTLKGKTIVVPISAKDFKPAKSYFKQGLLSFKNKQLTPFDFAAIEAAEKEASSEQAKEARWSVLERIVAPQEARKEKVKQRLKEKKETLSTLSQKLKETSSRLEKLNAEVIRNEKVKEETRRVQKQLLEDSFELSKAKRQIENEITELEAEEEELQEYLDFFYEDGTEIVDVENTDSDLKSFRSTQKDIYLMFRKARELKDAIVNEIKGLLSLKKELEKTIDDVNTIITENFQKLKEKYPLISFGDTIEAIMLDPSIFSVKVLQDYPDLLNDVKTFNSELEFMEAEYVLPSLAKLQKLERRYEELTSQLESVGKDLERKQTLLEGFNEMYKELASERQRVKTMLQDKAFHDLLFKQNSNEGGIGTNSPDVDSATLIENESAKKPLQWLFASETSPTENQKPHHKRKQRFLKNTDGMPNRANLQVMFVNKRQAAELGISDMMEVADPNNENVIKDKDNPHLDEHLFVVFIESHPEEGKFYIDEKGERLAKIGDSISANDIIFSTLPTAETIWPSTKEPRYSKATAEEAKEYAEQWKKERKGLYDATDFSFSPFSVSRGRAIYETDKDGKTVTHRNAVTDVLITPDDIDNNPDLLRLSVKGVITIDGQEKPIPKGTIILNNKSTTEFVNNRNFTEGEVDLIFNLLRIFTRKANKDGNFEKDILSYLHGILFFSDNNKKFEEGEEGSAKVGRNQIFFKDGYFVMGTEEIKVPFSEKELLSNEALVKAFLRGAYMNVSRVGLKENKPFDEILSVDLKTGEVIKRTWKSYNHFLLSPTFVAVDAADPNNGKERKDIPLTTSILIPKEGEPTHVSKYAYFPSAFGFEETESSKKKKEEKKESKPKEKEKGEVPEHEVSLEKGKIIVKQTSKRNGKTYVYHIVFDQLELVEVLDEKGNSVTFTKDEKEKSEQIGKRLFSGYFTEDPLPNAKADKADGENWTKLDLGNNAFAYYEKKAGSLVLHAVERDGKSVRISDGMYAKIMESVYETEGLPLPSSLLPNPISQNIVLPKLTTEKTESSPSVAATAPISPSSVIPLTPSTIVTGTAEEEAEKREEEELAKKEREAAEKEIEGGAPFRRKVEGDAFKKADVQKEKTWIEKVLGVPVNILEHLIETTDGGYAWGMFKKNAIYLYEAMEEGTGYHEAFEAVWAMFLSDAQRDRLVKEFKKRKGSFIDRETQTEVMYSSAEPHQIKEQMAEELRDYKLNGTLPPTPHKSALAEFFSSLIDFIKKVFFGTVSEKELFERIDAGYYKGKSTVRVVPNTEEYSRVAGLDEADTYKLIKNTTAALVRSMFESGIPLTKFEETQFDADELYEKTLNILRYELVISPKKRNEPEALLQKRAIQFIKIKKDWGNIKSLTNEYLKTANLMTRSFEVADLRNEKELTDNQEVGEIKEESEMDENASEYAGRNSDSYVRNVFKADGKLTNSTAIKLLLGTISEAYYELTKEKQTLTLDELKAGVSANQSKETIKKVDESTGLPMIINFAKLFNQMLSEIGGLHSHQEKMAKLKELANTFPEYQQLAHRLFIFNDELTDDMWDMRILFFNTFSRQNPIPLVNFILEDGRTYIGSADLDRESDRLISKWVEGLKSKAFNPNEKSVTMSYGKFKFDPSNLTKPHDPVSIGKFFNQIGIDISADELKQIKKSNLKEYSKILDSASSIFIYISNKSTIDVSTYRSLDVSGPLKSIANAYTRATMDGSDSTYYGIEGTRLQRHVLNNTFSNTLGIINAAESLDEVYEKLPHLAERGGMFSAYLNQLFTDKGVRIKSGDGSFAFNLNVSYVQGTIDKSLEFGNPRIPTAKLSERQRIVQEFNQNLNNNWYILLPGDSVTEWMISINKPVFEFQSFYQNIDNKKYLDSMMPFFEKQFKQETSEGALHLLMKEHKTFDLRTAIDKQMKANVAELKKYINETNVDENFLKTITGGGFRVTKSSKKQPSDFSDQWNDLVQDTEDPTAADQKEEKLKKDLEYNDKLLEQILYFRSANYMANQAEMLTMFFGDLSFYSEITKRAKSFGSPRENMFIDGKFDAHANVSRNQGLKQTDPGYTNFRNYWKTITVSDVITEETSITRDERIPKALRDAYKKNKSTDGQSWISMPAYRQLMIKSSRWNSKKEAMWQYVMALDRQELKADKKYKYSSQKLENADLKLIRKGAPNDETFEILKPIATGFSDKANPVLDKTSSAPISYSAFRGTNLASHVVKMWQSDVDYIIAPSGRKVQDKKVPVIPFYEKGNKYSNNSVLNVPHMYYGIQVETNTDSHTQVRGSQVTANVTANLMSGEDVIVGDTQERKQEIKELVSKNKRLLDEYTDLGLRDLLEDLGLDDENGEFRVIDREKLLSFIKRELGKREIASALKDALQLNEDGTDFLTPLEVLPNYLQIKQILYSNIDSQIARPVVNGAPHIQMSGSGLETGERLVKDGVYAASGLLFYEAERDENGKIIKVGKAQVKLPFWAGAKLKQKMKEVGLSFASEKELLEHLQKSPDFEEMMTAIGFRIPTQDMNSIEALEIVGFLPEWMGSSVMVPEALVTKAGSDFDVDKLNMYLKNIYLDAEGNIRTVKYFENFEEHFEYYKMIFEKELNKSNEKAKRSELKNKNLREILKKLQINDSSLNIDKWASIIDGMKGDLTNEQFAKLLSFRIQKAQKKISELTDVDLQTILLWEFVDKMRKESIQNEYFKTLEQLITLPENFERLLQPNSVNELTALRDELVEISISEFGTGRSSSVFSSSFMSKLRHFFIVGKRGVGIAAVNLKNQMMAQLAGLYIDPALIHRIPSKQSRFVKDLNLRIPHNQKEINGQKYSFLGGVQDSELRFITDKISQFLNGYVDISKDPFIIQLGATLNLASSFIMMEKLGFSTRLTVGIMNLPHLREYFKQLQSAGVSTVFYKEYDQPKGSNNPQVKQQALDILKNAKKLEAVIFDIIKMEYSEDAVEKTISQDLANEITKLVSEEFFKIAVYADQMFKVTQGTNHDTSSVLDYNMQYRKDMQKDVALNNTIFGNVEKLLDSTHVGKIADNSKSAATAISGIFKLDSGAFRNTLNLILDRLGITADNSADDFNYSARKAEMSMLNYVIQTANREGGALVSRLNSLLLDSKTSVATQLIAIQEKIKQGKLEKNAVIERLSVLVGNKTGEPNNIVVDYEGNDVFTLDLYMSALKELENNPHTAKFYEDLVLANFLQSGLANSKFSTSKIIPPATFKKIMEPILTNANSARILEAFKDTDAFFRNAWNDNTIVPFHKPKPVHFKRQDDIARILEELGINAEGYPILKILTKDRNINRRYVRIIRNNPKFTGQEMSAMMKVGDFSFRETVLMKRLDISENTPLIIEDNYGDHAIYVPVSAWGMGQRAYEANTSAVHSIFSNGTFKPTYKKGGKESAEITTETWLSVQNKFSSEGLSSSGKKVINVYYGGDEIQTNTRILSNLASREFVWEGRTYGSVEHAYQSLKNGFDQEVYDNYVSIGGFGKKISKPIKDKSTKKNLYLLKDLIIASFVQNANSSAAKKLLTYDDFTHFGPGVAGGEIDKYFIYGLRDAKAELQKRKEDKQLPKIKPCK
jgi:hypothetical protein